MTNREYAAEENMLRHNPSYWALGRFALSNTENDGRIGTEYDNANTQIFALRYKNKIPVTAGETYTIKAWGIAMCRLYFYTESEATPAPAHPAHWEDIEMSDDTFISLLLWNSTKNDRNNLPTGYTFTVPNGATYMRLDSYVLDDAGAVRSTSMLELGSTHLYKLETGAVATTFTPSPYDCNLINDYTRQNNERPQNNPVAARQLVACMSSYSGRGWIYGRGQMQEDTANNKYTFKGPADDSLFTVSEINENYTPTACEKSLDCATPIKLAISGIPYWQSRYEQLSNRWRGAKFYPWGKYQDTARGSSFLEWIYKNGWEINPGINYDKLQAGDLVFWHSTPYKVEWPYFKGGFRNWDHVAMYTGRWMPDPDRNNELHPECIETKTTGTAYTKQDGTVVYKADVKRRFLDRGAAAGTLHATSSSPATVCMFARIPLGSPYAEYDSEGNNSNSLDTATHKDCNSMIYSLSYKPSVYIEGKVSDGGINIDIYGMNAAVWEINGVYGDTGIEYTNAKRIRSNFLPATWKVQNYISQTDTLDWTQSMTSRFILITRYFYDGSFTPLSSLTSSRAGEIPAGAKYVRYCYGTSGNDFNAYELAGFNTFVSAQPDVTKTVGNIVNGGVRVNGVIKPRLAYNTTKAYYDGVTNTAAKYRAFGNGYHSYVHIPLSDLPLGEATSYAIDAHSGEYSLSSDDGLSWHPLSEEIQTLLKNLRIADGESYIYIPNGQRVVLSNALV